MIIEQQGHRGREGKEGEYCEMGASFYPILGLDVEWAIDN